MGTASRVMGGPGTSSALVTNEDSVGEIGFDLLVLIRQQGLLATLASAGNLAQQLAQRESRVAS